MNHRVARLVLLLGCFAFAVRADQAAELEFFEKKIRPVLVERCYKCHSAESEKLKGGLRLDSRAGMLKGGETMKPSVVPDEPEKSLLIEAIAYQNADLQMPPKGKLSEQEIADFKAWIKAGALWPGEEKAISAEVDKKFDLHKRKEEHWAWKPIVRPSLPEVSTPEWRNHPVDRFLVARLEQAGLRPAARADSATLTRRLFFDLIGLPPASGMVKLPEKYDMQELAQALLASPHFGERWARHWLDLVRYAETLGHEFDYQIPNAWRYRDYVIRAFNRDLPYHQFVMEQVAGDLLDKPRFHPAEGFNESAIGPAFYWLGQRDHSPVDVRLHQAELIDNQIDVLTKTFLGLTVSCARCHDHKFDAISTQDYYALYGVLASSRYVQASLAPRDTFQTKLDQLRGLKSEIRQATAQYWLERVQEMGELPGGAEETEGRRDGESAEVEQKKTKETESAHPKGEGGRLGVGLRLGEGGQMENADGIEFVDFLKAVPEGWVFESGDLQAGLAAAGEFVVGKSNRPFATIFEATVATSAKVSTRLEDVLFSPTFKISHRFIHVLCSGRDSRANVRVDNFTVIRDPIYGGLRKPIQSDTFTWLTFDARMWLGHHAYLEFSDLATPDPSTDGSKPEGWYAVARVHFSDQKTPPALGSDHAEMGTRERETKGSRGGAGARSRRGGNALATKEQLREAMAAWGRGEEANLSGLIPLLGEFLEQKETKETKMDELASLLERYREVESSLPLSPRAPSMIDGTGHDEVVFVRGNHRTPGAVVPRRFLEALGGSAENRFHRGSGRLELAQALVSDGNPLLPRVIVNRVWAHLFGRGLVASPDDFGALGQRPTHPELLDWLADWFRREGGWSIKKLIAFLVSSQAYQMSALASDPKAAEIDPENKWWHRMPLRRLEGEAVRDAILSISGRLDPAMHGPSVPVHLTEFMDGRGRPGSSGPLDGAGRRSIYLEIRRNFLSPMMRAFDAPVPFTTVGRRTESNVPAQSLIMMNDPFVVEQAASWAKKILAENGPGSASSMEDRIGKIYQAALGRLPERHELDEARQFIEQQTKAYAALDSPTGASANLEEKVWSDYCHVVFNLKEFLFLK